MNVSRYLFIALAFSFTLTCTYKSYSLEHIPFYGTNESGEDVTICCIGPWFRQICGDEGQCTISGNAVDDNFYSADVDIFSPYGSWFCCLVSNTPFSNCSGGPRSGCNGTGSFTLSKEDTAVYFTMDTDSLRVKLDSSSSASTTQVLPSEESDTSSTQANLGDDNTKPRRDRDTWSIRGTEGENVVITLEVNPSAGHDGEEATLTLQNGNSTIESTTDALPLEISTTLPSTGEYRLVVSQNDIPEGVRYRGRYTLSVKSSLGIVQDIKPSEDVEQF